MSDEPEAGLQNLLTNISPITVAPIMADTGRPVPLSVAVTQIAAGRHRLRALKLDGGGWTLPALAVTVFVEAHWEQQLIPHKLVLQLIDGDGRPVHYFPGPNGEGLKSSEAGEVGQPVRLERDVIIGRVAGAPEGTPSRAAPMIDLPAGAIWVPAPERRYVWLCSVGGYQGQYGFWVTTAQD